MLKKLAARVAYPKVYILFFAVIIIWGLSWPVSKIGMGFVPAIWFSALRLFFAMLAMFVIMGSLGKLIFPTKKDLPVILTIGFFQMGLFSMFINLGLYYVDAGRSAILTYTTPFWVLPLAVLLFNEKLTWLKFLGFLLGMSGIITLFGPWSIDWSDKMGLMGNGLLLLAALSFGISMLCARHLTWHRSALELLPWQLLVGTIPVLAFACIFSPGSNIEWNTIAVSTVVYTALLGTAIGYWCSTIISKELPSITVSIGFLGVPLSGLFFSSLILNEPLTASIKIAMILISGGLICVALGKKPV